MPCSEHKYKLMFYYRKKSSRSDKFAVSANMAYGQMKFGTTEGEYEDPDRPGQRTDTMTTATRSYESTTCTATYETVDTRSSPRVPEYVYARADEAVHTTNR